MRRLNAVHSSTTERQPNEFDTGFIRARAHNKYAAELTQAISTLLGARLHRRLSTTLKVKSTI
jgi:hypothetical protein